MLVISRNVGESVVITLDSGERIVVKVTNIDRGKIKLGFDVPKEIPVFRSEIQDAIDREAV